ncbi:type IV pilus modification PilV family protein [Candidatus Foliamicus sp.]
MPAFHTQGFSLAECLLAVALFSFGLLGAGALSVERLREARAAHTHFVAAMLAQDLAARIQADPQAAGGGHFQEWRASAAQLLAGLQCTITALGGTPPAYRLQLDWPLGADESARLTIWIGQ